MAEQLLEHFGADSIAACLADAGRDPVWTADVIAQREAERYFDCRAKQENALSPL